MTLDALYSPAVLRLAADAHGAGPLRADDVAITCVNPTCGDRIDVALALSAGTISRFVYHTGACLICQASASALGASIVGKTSQQIEGLRAGLRAMLKSGGAPPPAPFTAFAALAPVAYEKSRHACVLLPLDAAAEALERAAGTSVS